MAGEFALSAARVNCRGIHWLFGRICSGWLQLWTVVIHRCSFPWKLFPLTTLRASREFRSQLLFSWDGSLYRNFEAFAGVSPYSQQCFIEVFLPNFCFLSFVAELWPEGEGPALLCYFFPLLAYSWCVSAMVCLCSESLSCSRQEAMGTLEAKSVLLL